jgi:simple sugar transport system permease protein
MIITSYFIGMDMTLLFNESLIKFAMNGVLVLSLIPMLNGGVGMNFGLPIGITAGLVGMCISLNLKLTGIMGFLVALLFGSIIGIILGFLYGIILNNVKGKEDIAGTFIGFSFIPLMNYFWTLAPFTNRKMLYPIGGKGLRPRIGLGPFFEGVLDNLWVINIGRIQIPLGLLLFYVFLCLCIYLFFKSTKGRGIIAIGENEDFAHLSGLDINKSRIEAVIMSTVIASIGIVVYAQSYGFLELYNGPLMMAFPAVSAILIGGSMGRRTFISYAIVGTYLFQSIYLLSVPIANELLLPEISEIFRMIIANSIILYALLKRKGPYTYEKGRV